MKTEREKLLDKIRGLLSKTVENNCSEHEALAALAKARAMRDAYEVTDDELSLTKDEKAILRREPKETKDPHRIKRLLCTAVARFCDCTAWRDRDHLLVFCGLRPDAQFGTWLLDTLAAFVQAEVTNHLMGSVAVGNDRRDVIRSFVWGCTERISQRLNELCEQSTLVATSNAKALVVIKDAVVKAKLDELGICLHTTSISGTPRNEQSLRAGKAAGDRASFGRPVSGRNATLRLK
jgi:hypothetical protein